MAVTAAEFRRIALSFPETAESSHMDHPDFRVRGKIFATLNYPGKGWGMVKLSPEYQDLFLREAPQAFNPSAGAWGRKGSTSVRLNQVSKGTIRRALTQAWRNAAPKPVRQEFDEGA